MVDPVAFLPPKPFRPLNLRNSGHDLAYLDLSGLPLKRDLSSYDVVHGTLAYLHLHGPLSEVMLSPRFRTFRDKYVPVKLDDYVTTYCCRLERTYRRTGDVRCLEALVAMHERFGRLETKTQRRELFERVFEHLYRNRGEDSSDGIRHCLRRLLGALQGTPLSQLRVWALEPGRLEFFLGRTRGFREMLMETEDPVHRFFVDACPGRLAVVLNQGMEQKTCRLKWYLKRILTRKKEGCCDEDFSFWYNYFQAYGIYDRDYLLRRLFLTLQLLYVILYRIPEGLRDCLRLLWKTIPDTYVTAEELELVVQEMPVRKKLSKSYEAFMNSSKYREIKKYINRPRDLKHYSRCLVRQCLIQSRTLPEGIGCLNLPKELQSYMLLESGGGNSTNFVPV